MVMFNSLLAVVPLLTTLSKAEFGLTDSDGSYVVDAGSTNSLVVTVDRASCDVTSIVYRGTDLQWSSPYTHPGSGLGSATVSAETIQGLF